MPTIFSHAIAAAAVGHLWHTTAPPGRLWAWAVACALLPDADVIGFVFGVRYGDMLGHRGITHSLLFAACTGVVVARLSGCGTALRTAAFFAVVTASHPLLDALTDGGRGVALLAPFSEERYFFPWTPIAVSPIGTRFFSARGVRVIVSELYWIWAPATAVSVLVWFVRTRPSRGHRRGAAERSALQQAPDQ